MFQQINQGLNYQSLPLSTNNRHNLKMSASTKLSIYFSRLLKYDQMDFEFAFWQMMYLFIAPQKVFQNFQHRKKSKAQFARDDPAFLVLFTGCLFVTYLGYMLVLNLTIPEFMILLIYGILIDYFTYSMIIATIFWYILNKYSDVEWGFAFDVHLNAIFPPLLILNISQLISYSLYKFIEYWFLFTYIEIISWVVGISYYFYITFLGYRSLGILKRPEWLLTPIPVLISLYILYIAYQNVFSYLFSQLLSSMY